MPADPEPVLAHFDRLARRMEAPPKFVLEAVKETVATARKEWPGIIREVGLPENMRDRLFRYWGRAFRPPSDNAIAERTI